MAVSEPLLDQYGPDGLPVGDEKTREKEAAFAKKFLLIIPIGRIIGFGIAFAIYRFGSTETYDASAKAAFNSDGKGTGAYVFFSAVLFSLLTAVLNMYPLISKARVMLKNQGIRPNMYIFKINNPDGAKSPCVILEEGGDAGKYNRANRSLHNHTEWASGLVFTAMCASHVFPFPVFVLLVIAAVGRLWHQVSYSASGFGAHAPGFGLFVVGYITLEMLTLIAGVLHLTLNTA